VLIDGELTSNGAYGDARRATAAMGEELTAEFLKRAASLLESFMKNRKARTADDKHPGNRRLPRPIPGRSVNLRICDGGGSMEQEERDQYWRSSNHTGSFKRGPLAGAPRNCWRGGHAPGNGRSTRLSATCGMRALGYLHRYSEILAKDKPDLPDVDGSPGVRKRQYSR